MILSQKQIEEIAAAVTEDFNKFFFGTDSEEVRMARATPIDQFARDYQGDRVQRWCVGFLEVSHSESTEGVH